MKRELPGTVTLWVDPEADFEGTAVGSIAQVEFDLVDSSGITSTLATDTSVPYYTTWNTTGLANGAYTIRATAVQEGLAVGSVTGSATFTVDSTIQAISLDSRTSWIVSAGDTISATPQGDIVPSSVEFWLFVSGGPILLTTCSASPYQWQVNTSFPDGPYQLQVIARYEDGSSYYGALQQITLANNTNTTPSIGSLVSQTADDSTGMLVNVVVTAGTDCTTLGDNASSLPNAFYVEDADRSGGIRVETSAGEVVEGEVVTINGIIHKTVSGATPRERYIEATEVDSVGSQSVPSPLGMTNKMLGGSAPAGSPGVLNGTGLLNVGLLVRVWGSITYVGSDCFYIGDGSTLRDGNVRGAPVIVPLDGSAPDSSASPVGVRVYCGSLAKPGLGDYVAVTGISSSFKIGANIVRCVRMRDTAQTPPGTNPDLTLTNAYSESYTQAAKEPTWSWSTWDGHFTGVFVTTDSSGDIQELEEGSKVRLENALVESQTGTGVSNGVLRCRHHDWIISPKMTGSSVPEARNMWWPVFVSAYTGLSKYQGLTILGTTYVNSDYEDDQWINPDRIYLCYPDTSPNGESMTMSVRAADDDSFGGDVATIPGEAEPGGGPIGPPTDYDDSWVLQTDWFKQLDSQVGNIGWALSQQDGSVVNLPCEDVVEILDGGQTLAIKEWFEPGTPAPRLVLSLGTSVAASVDTMATIDIMGAALTTLPDGSRALINPQAVYVYLDEDGDIACPMPPFIKCTDSAWTWPWRARIAP